MEWPRRKFLVSAAAGVAAIAGAAAFDPGAFQERRPEAGAEAPGRAVAGITPAELPIHGSPRLLSTGLPARAFTAPWTSHEARLIHFHLPGGERDRLLLGLP